MVLGKLVYVQLLLSAVRDVAGAVRSVADVLCSCTVPPGDGSCPEYSADVLGAGC